MTTGINFFSVLILLLTFSEYYFVKPCHERDPNINKCLQKSANYLMSHIRRGIPQLQIEPPEPIIIDEIGLALGTGPDGYRATFRNIKAYGISNLTITAVRYIRRLFFLLKRIEDIFLILDRIYRRTNTN